VRERSDKNRRELRKNYQIRWRSKNLVDFRTNPGRYLIDSGNLADGRFSGLVVRDTSVC
jgi:hypothetical protein